MHFAELPGVANLCKPSIRVLQLNVGDRCNQTCRHCHASSGPDREQLMPRALLLEALALLDAEPGIVSLDITGGSPELHPDMVWFLTALRARGRQVLFRSNLTALATVEPALLEALLALPAELAASLPGLDRATVDEQRGDGIFVRSLAMLRELNRRGFGTGRAPLTLVFNPKLAELPPPQQELETTFRHRLQGEHGIHFDRLHAIANQPLGRLLEELRAQGLLRAYRELLERQHNPAALGGVMCRYCLSVGSDGGLHDCEFNRAAGLPLGAGAPASLAELRQRGWQRTSVVVGDHCFACTVRSGYS